MSSNAPKPNKMTLGQRRGAGLRVKHGLDELGNLDALPEKRPRPQLAAAVRTVGGTSSATAADGSERCPLTTSSSSRFPLVATLGSANGTNGGIGIRFTDCAAGSATATPHVFGSWREWGSVKRDLFDAQDYEKVRAALAVVEVWQLRSRTGTSGSASSTASASAHAGKRSGGAERTVPIYVRATCPLIEALWLDRLSSPPATDDSGALVFHAEAPRSGASDAPVRPMRGVTESVLRLQYGAAISRAVHLLTGELHAGTAEADGETYRTRARAVGVPEEAVEVRLRVAHQSVPGLAELRLVTGLLLRHLHTSFWLVQERDLDALKAEESAAQAAIARHIAAQVVTAERQRVKRVAGQVTKETVEKLLGDLAGDAGDEEGDALSLEQLEKLAREGGL